MGAWEMEESQYAISGQWRRETEENFKDGSDQEKDRLWKSKKSPDILFIIVVTSPDRDKVFFEID